MEDLTSNPSEPIATLWGLAPPPELVTIARWSARAIYTENRGAHAANTTKRGGKRKRGAVPYFEIGLLWDRQSGSGNPQALPLLQTWINVAALPWLRGECSDRFVTPECNIILTFSDGCYTLMASPRESFGYLYIGAWMV